MCGIVGLLDNNKDIDPILNDMVSEIAHRGPDSNGTKIFRSDKYSLGLGHTRLSIIDTSVSGNQPMHFQYLEIVYNGEIYNYLELKNILMGLGYTFKTSSDTEVILQAYMHWGTDSFSKFIGMFSIAIYNKKKHELVLARDRAGIKPFYYYHHKNLFMFSSELKSFHKHPHFDNSISIDSVIQYFDY